MTMHNYFMKTIFICTVAFFSFITAFSTPAWCQTNAQNTYVSAVDQDLAIKSIVLIPTTDNVDGIYAKPIHAELTRILNDDKQWSLTEMPKDYKVAPSIESKPDEIKKILQASKAEAALTSKIIRGPKGMSVRLTLFVGRDGLPLLEENLSDYQGFEISELKVEVQKLFENLKYRLPFRATILSRRGQQVTLNLGSNYGLKADSRVSVVQIIKVHRHPKHQFMVSTEKEVLGRVKLFKVEPYLSFGYIEMEKEPGVITVGSKITPDEFVKYSVPVTTPSGKVLQDITERPDKEVAFGEEPTEWLPTAPPQYGKIDLLAGLSNYTQNLQLRSAGAVSGSNNLAPNILLRGEIWLTPTWYLGAQLRQSVFSLSNSLANSNPGSLNMAMSQYEVVAGYNLLLSNDYFGPKLQISAGSQNTNFSVDDSGPARSFTSMKYGGMLLRLAGHFPLSGEVPLDLGAKFDLFLSPSLSENISSGASSSNQINNFSFYGEYRLKTRMRIRAELLFENYNSDFTGVGQRTDSASSVSHKMTSLLGGVQYLF